ncbi:MAG TPA: caspase family protein [Thermoanaerobaculia bacterium]|nr:caspase family protein [Thermoanaerobaculia bacterium]
MRKWILPFFSLVLIATGSGTLLQFMRGARSAGPVSVDALGLASGQFQRKQAVGMFVGVTDFDSGVQPVPYAVDDAVDLAWMFALDRRVSLVPPSRVVLALSGRPVKAVSQQRLEELITAGAKVVPANTVEIFQTLQKQAAAAGRDGMVILSMATHGFMHNGSEYILGRSSTYRDPETSLSIASLLDVVALSPARRSLIFVDACRDRVMNEVRSAGAPPAVAHQMKRIAGQAVFYAAAAGNYAYDDVAAQNGVFTSSVIAGLACNATSPRQTVTVDTLHTFVERSVKKWIVDNKKPPVEAAIQVNVAGNTESMPLSQCWQPPGIQQLSAAIAGSRLIVKNQNGHIRSDQSFASPILQADVGDIDADGIEEIAVALEDTVAVYDDSSNFLWKTRVPGIRTLAMGDLYRKHSDQIVAMTDDALTIFDRNGKRLDVYDEVKGLRHLRIGLPSSHHKMRIVAATDRVLLVLGTVSVKPWRLETVRARIRDVNIVQRSKDDDRSDIVVTTDEGKSYFDFAGKQLRVGQGGPEWKKPAHKKARMPSIAKTSHR